MEKSVKIDNKYGLFSDQMEPLQKFWKMV